jgi:hypothetical protein
MSLTSLFNQDITVYTKSGYDSEGRETLSSSTTYKARVQESNEREVLPDGSVITIALVVYTFSTVTIDTDYKVTYNGVDYKVYSKYSAVDGVGNVNHIKLKLIKWL